MLSKPLRRQAGDFLQRSPLLKQMSGPRHNDQLLVGRSELLERVLVHSDDCVVAAADDEQCGGLHERQRSASKVWSTAAGDDGADPLRALGRRYQGCPASGTGAEITRGQM
jgi:hypothetical protein